MHSLWKGTFVRIDIVGSRCALASEKAVLIRCPLVSLIYYIDSGYTVFHLNGKLNMHINYKSQTKEVLSVIIFL